MNRLVGKNELSLRFHQNTLPYQVTSRDTGCAFDVIVEFVGRHRQLTGIKTDKTFFAEILVDEPPQFIELGRPSGTA